MQDAARQQPFLSFSERSTSSDIDCRLHSQPARVYHHTGPVNTMYGLREGLALLAEEGLEKCWQRHRECADKLYQGKRPKGPSEAVPDSRIQGGNSIDLKNLGPKLGLFLEALL